MTITHHRPARPTSGVVAATNTDRVNGTLRTTPEADTGIGGAAGLLSEISGYLHERWREPSDRPSGKRPRKRVLLPYTDSPPGRRALDAVIDLSDLLQPDVRVLHLREWIPARGGPLYVETPEEAQSTLSEALGVLEREGIAATGVVASAPLPRLGVEIAAAAVRMQVSAVVVGASRHPWLSSVLRGSVSTEVAYAATCPVILVGTRGTTLANARWRPVATETSRPCRGSRP